MNYEETDEMNGITYSSSDFHYPGQSGLSGMSPMGGMNGLGATIQQFIQNNKKTLIYAGLGALALGVVYYMGAKQDSEMPLFIVPNPKKKGKLSRRQIKELKKLWSKWEEEEGETPPPIPKGLL